MDLIETDTTRYAITHKFVIDGIKGYITVGLQPNGMPHSIFINIQKEGSTVGGFADAFARLVSISLQHGIPLSLLCRKLRGLRFEPNGLTTNSNIPLCESIVDYIFTWMEQTFLNAKA